MLNRTELFELYARHRANPQYWDAARLAEAYGTKTEWVAVLLQFVAPPLYARVDGDVYGVFDIRPVDEFEARMAAADAAASGGAAAGGGAGSGTTKV